MAEMAEKSTVSYPEEFLFVNAIRESRRRRQNLQMVLKNLAAWRRKVLNVCFLLLLRGITIRRQGLRKHFGFLVQRSGTY